MTAGQERVRAETKAEDTTGAFCGCLFGALWVGVVVLGVYFAYWRLILGPESRPPDLPVFDTQAAHDACAHFVTATLDTPSTASFPGRFNSDRKVRQVTEWGGNVPIYRVLSYVDAQNKFGAVIRTRFVCSVSWDAKAAKWVLLGLHTEPWNEPQAPDSTK
jgi:hypothetical protein